MNDKLTEYARYEIRAKEMINMSAQAEPGKPLFGAEAILPIFRAPYIFYEQCVRETVFPMDTVLELGAGTGLHTRVLVKTGARVVASDISPNSLKLLDLRMRGAGESVMTQVADMEYLPFRDHAFSVVTCAGSLSYGDPRLVHREILRVLSPGGTFLCVDALNHNPVYRFNRWTQYVRRKRAKSTISRMPTLDRIQSFCKFFSKSQIRFFGAAAFLMPLAAFAFGQHRASQLSDSIDAALCVKKSAFKFVLVAKGRLDGVFSEKEGTG